MFMYSGEMIATESCTAWNLGFFILDKCFVLHSCDCCVDVKCVGGLAGGSYICLKVIWSSYEIKVLHFRPSHLLLLLHFCNKNVLNLGSND